MVISIWVNIGLGNGLLPDGTTPLPEPMLASHQRLSGIHLKTILQEVLINLIRNICSKIELLKLLPHLPGINELTKLATFRKI